MRRRQLVSTRGPLALAVSVLMVFQPVLGAQHVSYTTGTETNEPLPLNAIPNVARNLIVAMVISPLFLSGGMSTDDPALIAIAKLTGTADRNDQPLLNGSVVTSGDSLRTHGNSALLLASSPGERLWLGPNTNVRLTKNEAGVQVALGRGTVAFETRGHIHVTIDNHEGLALRSRSGTPVQAQLSLFDNQQAQVRVQQGYLELVEGDRSVVLQPARDSSIATRSDPNAHQVPSGQTAEGSINGTVVDAQLFVVAGAQITLTNAAGKTLTTTSSQVGNFTLSNLPPGVYTLQVSKPGLKPYELKDVVVRSGNESSLLVHLGGTGKQGGGNNLLIWVLVGGAAAGGIGAYLATRGSSNNTNSPSSLP